MDLNAQPTSRLHGDIILPADKSIAQRSAILAARCDGTCRLLATEFGDDVWSTLTACQQLGVQITKQSDSLSLTPPKNLVNNQSLMLGNSGTGARLLLGLLASQGITTRLDGDASLRLRPMQRVVNPLNAMGASIQSNSGKLPLTIQGRQLIGVRHQLNIASSQVKTAIIFAALFARGETTILQVPTRDHLELLLQHIGYPIAIAGNQIKISGGHRIPAFELEIPGDFSAAAFFIVAATITKQAQLRILNVGINPRRTALLSVLSDMGAKITLSNQRLMGLEPVADITVNSAQLRGVDVPSSRIVDMIDEFPALCIAAAHAVGKTVFRNASELRVKESDRLAMMSRGLRAIGIDVHEFSDGLAITGGEVEGGVVDSGGDHRIAMAFSLAGIIAKQAVIVENCQSIQTSFPSFVETAKRCGMQLQLEETA